MLRLEKACLGDHIKFGEFLGVIFEAKEDRVLGLLREIEIEASWVRREEKKGPIDGRQKCSSKDNDGERKLIVYKKRNRSKERSRVSREESGGEEVNFVIHGC